MVSIDLISEAKKVVYLQSFPFDCKLYLYTDTDIWSFEVSTMTMTEIYNSFYKFRKPQVDISLFLSLRTRNLLNLFLNVLDHPQIVNVL